LITNRIIKDNKVLTYFSSGQECFSVRRFWNDERPQEGLDDQVRVGNQNLDQEQDWTPERQDPEKNFVSFDQTFDRQVEQMDGGSKNKKFDQFSNRKYHHLPRSLFFGKFAKLE
jgi:hypothetical protein